MQHVCSSRLAYILFEYAVRFNTDVSATVSAESSSIFRTTSHQYVYDQLLSLKFVKIKNQNKINILLCLLSDVSSWYYHVRRSVRLHFCVHWHTVSSMLFAEICSYVH